MASISSAPTHKYEQAPWLLMLSAVAMLALLAWTTIAGSLASNRAAAEPYRAIMLRDRATAEAAGLDLAVVHRGRAVYLETCTACHGPNGEALPNLGKDLSHSEFVATQSDGQLQMFLKLGRSTWDPANTTGVDMPGKGGNPKLDDDDLADTVQFLRFIQASQAR